MSGHSSHRRVGVEIEFAGISLEGARDLVSAALDVAPRTRSPHEFLFDDPSNGEWRLEIDFQLLKRLSRKQFNAPEDDTLRKLAINALDAVASLATPMELVTPPLPESRLAFLDELVAQLGAVGATGTNESAIHAFGVHFNPEATLQADVIVAHLKAFLCLFDWLRDRDSTDLTRRLTPYIDPFPEAFEREVLEPQFQPDLTGLVEHYLAHNPTRNRALDLLPLLAEIDAERVRAQVDDDLIKPRPTWHYRLPNSRVGDPDWRVTQPWSDWLVVERLANSPEALGELCQARLEYLDRSLFSRREERWIEQCSQAVSGL